MDKSDLIEKINESMETLASNTDAVAQSAEFKRWLSTMAAFHAYSFNNQMLIAVQRPSATNVAGFHAWKGLGRHVLKGAKGIAILAPMVGKSKEEGENGKARVFGFRTVYVFDIADTDGEPLADIEHRATDGGDDLLPRLLAVADRYGMPVRFLPQAEMLSGANGYCTVDHIAVLDTLPTAGKCGTLAHELAHHVLHFADRKAALELGQDQRELEAEAVAYVVNRHFGLEHPSEFYLASYNATAERIRESLSTIRAAAAQIIDAAAVDAVAIAA